MDSKIVLPKPLIESGWAVVKKVGEGSYGAVYKIERPIGNSKETAALKVIDIPKSQDEVRSMRSSGYDDKSIITRYEIDLNRIIQEYQMMMSMKGHSNIVSCEDVYKERLEDGIGWRVYIRMEFLTSLLDYKAGRSFSEEETKKLGIDICQALVYCEQKNIVHRDIKPENIMVSDFGSFKLGDFGIARTMDHATTGTNIGTRPYMAPEVIQGQKYDQRVDIYSLGMVLYWLLNNSRLPFIPQGNKVPDYETVQSAYEKRIRGAKLPAPINGSEEFKRIVLKACAYRPEDRYNNANEMLKDLNSLRIRSEEKGSTIDDWKKTMDPDTLQRIIRNSNQTQKEKTTAATGGTSWQDINATMGGPDWNDNSNKRSFTNSTVSSNENPKSKTDEKAFSSSGDLDRFKDIFGDIFKDMEGNPFGRSESSSKDKGPTQGKDRFMKMNVSFLDACFGTTENINLTVDEPCENCHGSGKKGMKTCHVCGGAGYVRKRVSIDVKIPAGISSGQMLRVAGKGERGVNGGTNGDLFIEVTVQPHKYYKREGKDIYVDTIINAFDAKHGTTVDVPTIYGSVTMKVPRGTKNGAKLRLRKKGVPDIRGGTTGDQICRILIKG